jgi:hypothetical protein
VTAIQRFGSALNLNVHFHTLAVQGVLVDDRCGGLPNPEPTEAEVKALLLATARRITRLAKRHGIDFERPQAEHRVDCLAAESPLLAGISGASVFGRVATGGRAGEMVVTRRPEVGCDAARCTCRAAGPLRWLRPPRRSRRAGRATGSVWSSSADTCCVRRSLKTRSS